MRRILHLFVILLVFLLVTVSFTVNTPVSAANPLILPSGFVDEVAYGGLAAPRAFAFTQDGRVLVLERGGIDDLGNVTNDSNFASIRVFKNGALLPTRAYTLDTCGDSERGALGIAVDPNFVSNGYIYVYYTRQATSGPDACSTMSFTNGDANGPRNRISRLTMFGDTVLAGSERVLIDSIITDIGYHNAGDLHFGTDNYLYASTGEAGLPWTSRDTATLNGKILRILPTPGNAGSYTTTGNPYNTASGSRYCSTIAPGAPGTLPGPCREIFASGFRNPFRFSIQPSLGGIPGTGSPFVGDVGGGSWEEIDQVRAGGDYGHPIREGYCIGGQICSPPYQYGGQVCDQGTCYDNPIYAYAHVAQGANFDSAVIGGDFYTGGASYPAQYLNNYFFADVVRGFIARLTYTGGQWVRSAQNFGVGTSETRIIGLKRGPDGNLYYLNFVSETDQINAIHRIRYSGAANQRPTAQISVNPQSGPLSTTYTFSAAGSTDPEGNTAFTYKWDFGDGSPLQSTPNLTVTHVYSQSVNALATLTVTDSGVPPATSAPVTVTVYPGNVAPTATIVLTNQTDGTRPTTFYAGDTWGYSVTNATDDDPLPANAFSWEIVFHHQNHTHPFIPFAPGDNGQFNIPFTGELDPDVKYRIHLYVTDARGQRAEFTRDITPVTKVLTFDTNPHGGNVTIEGVTFPTPLNITRVVGMHFNVTVPSPQIFWGYSFNFNSWSQGGNQQQTITVPSTNTTYTAMFNAPANMPPPRNYFTTHTPTLTWNRVSWATRYEMRVANNSAFSGATIYQVGSNLAFTLPVLGSRKYFWQVRACSTSTTASCGGWSVADSFVVDAP